MQTALNFCSCLSLSLSPPPAQVKSQGDLEKQQREIKGSVKTLKREVRGQLRTGLRDLSQAAPEPLEVLEAPFEAERTMQSEWESLKENYPFAANEARTPGVEGKLDLSKVHVMVSTGLKRGCVSLGLLPVMCVPRAAPTCLMSSGVSSSPRPQAGRGATAPSSPSSPLAALLI